MNWWLAVAFIAIISVAVMTAKGKVFDGAPSSNGFIMWAILAATLMAGVIMGKEIKTEEIYEYQRVNCTERSGYMVCKITDHYAGEEGRAGSKWNE